MVIKNFVWVLFIGLIICSCTNNTKIYVNNSDSCSINGNCTDSNGWYCKNESVACKKSVEYKCDYNKKAPYCTEVPKEDCMVCNSGCQGNMCVDNCSGWDKECIWMCQYNSNHITPKQGGPYVEKESYGPMNFDKCTDGIDNDCDGDIDCEDYGCASTCPTSCWKGKCVEGNTSCYDSDNGTNIYKEGYVTYANINYSDLCFGRNQVSEYYCNGSNIARTEIECPYGCGYGACRNETKTCQNKHFQEYGKGSGRIEVFCEDGCQMKAVYAKGGERRLGAGCGEAHFCGNLSRCINIEKITTEMRDTVFLCNGTICDINITDKSKSAIIDYAGESAEENCMPNEVDIVCVGNMTVDYSSDEE